MLYQGFVNLFILKSWFTTVTELFTTKDRNIVIGYY